MQSQACCQLDIVRKSFHNSLARWAGSWPGSFENTRYLGFAPIRYPRSRPHQTRHFRTRFSANPADSRAGCTPGARCGASRLSGRCASHGCGHDSRAWRPATRRWQFRAKNSSHRSRCRSDRANSFISDPGTSKPWAYRHREHRDSWRTCESLADGWWLVVGQ